MDTTEIRAALAALDEGNPTLARRVLRAEQAMGLPATADGLVRYFTKVWTQHAKPAARRTPPSGRLVIPAGPWGPRATVYFNQRWVTWGAITCHRDIFLAGGRVSPALLAHEYTHTLQAEEAGGFLPYLRAWALLTARYGYRENQLEVEGYAAGDKLWALLRQYGAKDQQTYGPRDTWHPPYIERTPTGPRLAYGGVQYALPKLDTEVRGPVDPYLGVAVPAATNLHPEIQRVVREGPAHGRRVGWDDFDLDVDALRVEPRRQGAVIDRSWLDDDHRVPNQPDGNPGHTPDPLQADLGLIQEPGRDPDTPF